VPVATVAIEGARNAGLLAVQMLAGDDDALYRRLEAYKRSLIRLCRDKDRQVIRQWRTGTPPPEVPPAETPQAAAR
jgi:phosphoribosylcarboxyaminoimidazole (NCAIR) mutase